MWSMSDWQRLSVKVAYTRDWIILVNRPLLSSPLETLAKRHITMIDLTPRDLIIRADLYVAITMSESFGVVRRALK